MLTAIKTSVGSFLAMGILLGSAGVVHAADTLINSRPLREAVTVDAIVGHLEVFQGLAEANGGNRFAGSSGHLATLEYVEAVLQDAGYSVRRQEFSFPFFQELAAPELEELSPLQVVYQAGADILTFGFSGNGEVTAEVVPVDVQVPATGIAMTSGCEAADFLSGGASTVAGKIALIQRGTCPFFTKVQNAIAAGATGVVVFNQGTPGRLAPVDATVGVPVSIPVLSASYGVGEDVVEQVRNGDTVVMRMKTTTVSQQIHSMNLIADSPKGDPNQTLVFASSLTGPLDSPAINLPGSGAATMLELAVQLPKVALPRKRVRFIFFDGTQGQGGLFYRNSLSQPEWEAHEAYLGADALGSRNFARFVFDGDDSSGLNVSPPPDGSGLIESVFLEAFRSMKLPTAPLSGNIAGLQTFALFRQPFLAVGGLSTGAALLKTEQEELVFGGTAGDPYDPFLGAGNDLSSVDQVVLGQMKEALAHALYTLTRSKSAITDSGTLKPGKSDYTLPNEGVCGDELTDCPME